MSQRDAPKVSVTMAGNVTHVSSRIDSLLCFYAINDLFTDRKFFTPIETLQSDGHVSSIGLTDHGSDI